MSADSGILYAATGERHLREAAHSARSVRHVHPELPIALFTSQKDLDAHRGWLAETFDQLHLHRAPAFTFRDKIAPLLDTPFQKTLFLDGDTEMLGRVDDVFDLLDKYPLACCRDTTRYNLSAPTVPAVFSEPNTGVIAFRTCGETSTLFTKWLERYDEKQAVYQATHGSLAGYHDQPSFREVLFEAAFPFYVLPEEYNMRVYALWYAGARVRILHAREPYLTRWRNAINRSEDMRYGDGEPLLSRALFETKRWIKHRFLGIKPGWMTKEECNKTYPVPSSQPS